MKNWLLAPLLFLSANLCAQLDTLLFEDFEEDPSAAMMPFPTGHDTVWVNFDEDAIPPNDPNLPGNWFSEFAQFSPPGQPKNNVFASTSWLSDPDSANKNWLILPPIRLCGGKTSIHWKSAPLEGPAYLDGYFLRVSTTENFVESFDTILFGAAECTGYPASQTTSDPADFEFSPGYIHAKTFTDSVYFAYIGGTNRCKLEPHSYFLQDFAGKTVYLAFEHRSTDDNRLDLDDILVLGNKCGASPVAGPGGPFDIAPVLYPNPVDWQLNVLFSLKKGGDCRFSVSDAAGRFFFEEEKKGLASGRNSWFFRPKGLSAGRYFLKIESGGGEAVRAFSKI